MEILTTLLIAFLTAIIGYFIGTIQERNSIKWKENREAIQCAYACFDLQSNRIKANVKRNSQLAEKWDDLKYNKNFNIINKDIHTKVRDILEMKIYDPENKTYNYDLRDEFISKLDEILPMLKKELE